jgi:phage-related holin
MIGTNYIRDAVVITFSINEVLSIAENAALMGIPLPKVILKALDILKQKASFEEDN